MRDGAVRVRSMTNAFLTHGNDVLLLHRASTMEIAPGLWAGLGGHLEPDEMRDPERCVLREIEEESGIRPEQVRELRLQALVLRRRPSEIRVQYVYFGRALARRLGETSEGSLHWVPWAEALTHPMSASNRFVIERYLSRGPGADVWVGTLAGDADGRPAVAWASLRDWEAPDTGPSGSPLNFSS